MLGGALPDATSTRYIPGVSVQCSGPGGITSGWDKGAVHFFFVCVSACVDQSDAVVDQS